MLEPFSISSYGWTLAPLSLADLPHQEHPSILQILGLKVLKSRFALIREPALVHLQIPTCTSQTILPPETLGDCQKVWSKLCVQSHEQLPHFL